MYVDPRPQSTEEEARQSAAEGVLEDEIIKASRPTSNAATTTTTTTTTTSTTNHNNTDNINDNGCLYLDLQLSSSGRVGVNFSRKGARRM